MSTGETVPEAQASLPRELEDCYYQLDEVDREIVNLLIVRASVASEVTDIRANHSLSARDVSREVALLRTVREQAKERGVDPEPIVGTYSAILGLGRLTKNRPDDKSNAVVDENGTRSQRRGW